MYTYKLSQIKFVNHKVFEKFVSGKKGSWVAHLAAAHHYTDMVKDS